MITAMQSIFLTYYQRVILWNMVGAHQAQNIKEADVYLRVLGKIRLTDRETTESKFIAVQGAFSWNLPSAGYGDKDIELEDSEAAALITAVESFSPVRVNDAEWMQRVVTLLKPDEQATKVQ
jgi:hypothetical protein